MSNYICPNCGDKYYSSALKEDQKEICWYCRDKTSKKQRGRSAYASGDKKHKIRKTLYGSDWD